MDKQEELKREALREKFQIEEKEDIWGSDDITIDVGFSDLYVEWLESKVLSMETKPVNETFVSNSMCQHLMFHNEEEYSKNRCRLCNKPFINKGLFLSDDLS